MKNNQPVTQREYEIGEHQTLMSTTDPASRITYCNAAFQEVSGFARDELMGQPHHLVRHPDMPREAFADLWATLKAGHSWTALVKNRRKDGDHYWVRANVTPMMRRGHLAGYMSVRTRPGRDEVAAAEALYRAWREGKAGSLRLHKGIVVRSGLLGWLSAGRRMPVAARLALAVLGSAGLLVGAAAACGLSGAALAGFAGTALAVGGAATGWLQATIARPLATILDHAEGLAAGQPRDHRGLERVDEIGMILRAVNQSGLNLRALVDDVSGQVQGLEIASQEIAQANHDLSARTEQTAASLQETAASMEQMTASVTQNAEGARQVTQLAGQSCSVATHGGEVVGQVVGTMEQISQASRRIADIIGVIDGIAFQTNILALNAAVEAARAGEQGRGFAVVASEVRALAKRSADAAREVRTLIATSVEKVENGTRQADEAGRAIHEIVSQAQRVSDLVGEISSATVEQSSGIGQVNVAVSQLDQMTQQNAALVEQGSAAAQGLRDQAHKLGEAVAIYRA